MASNSDDGIELKVGMIAYSEEEAFNMYNKYAYNKGFSVRKNQKSYKRGTHELTRRSFVCWKEGFKDSAEPAGLQMSNRLDIRCGCQARILFKVVNGIFEVLQLIADHNHPLVEQHQRHLIKSARKIRDTTKGVISSMVECGIRANKTYTYLVNEAGGDQNVGFTQRDCHNFIQVERAKRIQVGDGQSIINHFKHKQAVEQMFFYTVQVDDENRMSNFFWRDGLSGLDYEYFGDVVVFDSTYRTNKYNMVCALFVGVNHHWKNILFGCAFLSNETTSSFVWLFKAFLESMDCKAPRTIFTDQCQAMASAINEVFPNTQHRLCQWHILENAKSNISNLYKQPGFKNKFCYLFKIRGSIAEFEEKWKEMTKEWDCSDHPWLLRLYNLREKWAPAFSQVTFSSNIRFSQRSESTNNVFQNMACKAMTLTDFVHHYEQNAEKMREAED